MPNLEDIRSASLRNINYRGKTFRTSRAPEHGTVIAAADVFAAANKKFMGAKSLEKYGAVPVKVKLDNTRGAPPIFIKKADAEKLADELKVGPIIWPVLRHADTPKAERTVEKVEQKTQEASVSQPSPVQQSSDLLSYVKELNTEIVRLRVLLAKAGIDA